MGGYFDLISKEEEINKIEKEMSEVDFWDNKKQAEEKMSKLSSLKSDVNSIKSIKNEIIDSLDLLDIAVLENENELKLELEKTVTDIRKQLEELEILVLLNDEYDNCNCILEIHSGAGGTEACDWAMMLFRMYSRWSDKKGYKLEIIDEQPGEEVGLKSLSALISGKNAYGYLKHEKGIHRLVRLSPFDSNNRRHTSFASVDIIPEIAIDDNSVEINEKDLKIDVYRSSGAGGQHVNTTDSAVRITHLPTKIVVPCQNGRSQIQNKEKAMQMLISKLTLLQKEENEQKLGELKGEQKNIDFGSQVRSYVMHPYSLVKDHRTNVETSNVLKVLDGDIDEFIDSNIRRM